ncbi:MAG: RNA-binding cell elongation regulator Jag/EloR [Chloroflexota bacterium]|mgnify:CR=1 FL=1
MESLEISAKTVDEAVELALQQLGAKLSEVEITILGEGRGGILGIGAENAKVRVTKLGVGRSRMSGTAFPPRPPVISYATDTSSDAGGNDDEYEDEGDEEDEEEQLPAELTGNPALAVGREVLESLLDRIGVDADIAEVRPTGPPPTGAGPVVAFDIRGGDLGLLIGRRGQTLASLQYLVNLIVARRVKGQPSVVVDVEGYRARRFQSLSGLAKRMADRVRQSGQAVTLEPMSASERRIIHMALQDNIDVITQSAGEGDARKVTIAPRGAGRSQGG